MMHSVLLGGQGVSQLYISIFCILAQALLLEELVCV